MKLDPNASVPMYLQLKAELKIAIAEQVYHYNERIPTEAELSKQYNVSRVTVRQAIQALCDEGLLSKKQGKGTFVRQRRIARKLDNLVSFTQACTMNHMVPSTTVLERRIDTLTPAELECFEDISSGPYFIVTRLRMADGVPVILEKNYFPLPQYEFLQSAELGSSLYQILDRNDIRIHTIRGTTLDVELADTDAAQRMGIKRGTPLFALVSRNYDKSGDLVHLCRELIVCERYHFSLVDYQVTEADYDGI